MAAARQLWRLCATGTEAPVAHPAALATGLQLHVRSAALASVLVQIGAAQQSYVALRGCAGCAHGRCEPGCRVEMLRRLLAQRAPGLALHPAPGGLAARPFTRAILAMPAGGATLTSALVQPWPEARLVVSWRPARQQRIQTMALLIVGAEGPSPSRVMRAHGWTPVPVPLTLGLRWAGAPLPLALPVGRPRQGMPMLLLPAENPPARPSAILEQPPPARSTAAPAQPTHGPDAQLAGWLSGLLANPQQPQEQTAASPLTEAPSPWPTGPGSLAPAALGKLVEQLIAEPGFQSERRGQSGLSKGRLVKNAGLGEHIARTLMIWFDQAGVLAQPEDGHGPWRAPRPFALTDLEQIAAKLRETPLPSSEEIRAAYGGEG